ncbi:DUF6776 family protein [Massilia sp. SM-13]|uniref:DUF6776 family protein n=1 Tax=Pseudoduganella rhizocola TaxID=3382643 RepID=UPI0038B48178
MAEPETVLVEQKAPLLVRVLGLTVVLMLAGALLVWGWDLGTRLIGASSKPAPAVVIEHTPSPVAGSAAASAAAEAAGTPAAGAAPSNAPAVAPAASGQGAGSAPAAAVVPAPAPGASASPAPATPSAPADPGAAAENGRLAADLALLESILPPVKPGAGLLIRGLQARMASASQLHYTILLGYGPKKGQPSFEGRLGIILQAKKDGKPLTLEFPTKEGAERYQLTVEDYQRIDGTLDLPAGVQATELKVTLSGGKTSVSQTTPVKTSP